MSEAVRSSAECSTARSRADRCNRVQRAHVIARADRLVFWRVRVRFQATEATNRRPSSLVAGLWCSEIWSIARSSADSRTRDRSQGTCSRCHLFRLDLQRRPDWRRRSQLRLPELRLRPRRRWPARRRARQYRHRWLRPGQCRQCRPRSKRHRCWSYRRCSFLRPTELLRRSRLWPRFRRCWATGCHHPMSKRPPKPKSRSSMLPRARCERRAR
jgi:hypothetical protein